MIIRRYLGRTVVGLAPEDVGKMMIGTPVIVPAINLILFFGTSDEVLEELARKENMDELI